MQINNNKQLSVKEIIVMGLVCHIPIFTVMVFIIANRDILLLRYIVNEVLIYWLICWGLFGFAVYSWIKIQDNDEDR